MVYIHDINLNILEFIITANHGTYLSMHLIDSVFL
ncbi:uncharacterized protein METZ01_LOCUS425174 [marine metagenome]|uniref:Uncharacterized protein n=1 Tax=marine metagenome TaxID=408172 RepID=A0A382XN96_9ZZZZ